MRFPSVDEWSAVQHALNDHGMSTIRGILTHEECRGLQAIYNDNSRYRSVIAMERYRFGAGEYKYFSYPLPPLVAQLRSRFYRPLVATANEWMAKLQIDLHYPDDHDEFLGHCQAVKQERPTPLILRYGKGGHNTLHQDLYGELFFPFQIVVALSERGKDYHGGELVFVEQVPRAQSRAHVLTPGMGDAVVFTTRFRPAASRRGYYRCLLKHGVSEVTEGNRYALGIIFHDSQ